MKGEVWKINQLFLFLGMLSIILSVLKAASAVVVPMLIAIAIAILLSPLFEIFEKYGVPRIAALIMTVVLSLTALFVLGAFLTREVDGFLGDSGNLASRIHDISISLSQKAISVGIPLKNGDLLSFLNPENALSFFQNMLKQFGNQLSNIFTIIFIAAFIVMDSAYYPAKLGKVFGKDSDTLREFNSLTHRIISYFQIKAKVSLLTAIWAMGVLWYLDIEYIVLWGFLVFFLNFIPVIGSILASIPPIVTAMGTEDGSTAIWVAVWYLIINITVGNIIEPRIMGRGLGLSSTTIFISMIFWGWMFGPAGMILSVPLTMAFQSLLMRYEETRWAGFLMSDYKGEEEAVPTSPPDGK